MDFHLPSAGELPSCAAPQLPVRPPSFDLPPGACDTHAHVISPDRQRYPLVADRSYTPWPAPEQAYLHMLQALGMQRGVLIQPSVYGTDNRYMLEVIERHPSVLRGVAVIDDQITDQELEHMHAVGVRGIRFNVLFRGGGDIQLMERLASKVGPLGWHIQFLIDVRDLPELQARMIRLPCPVVIDHMGHFPAHLGTREPGFALLRRNVEEHGWWVKLSGIYRLSERAPDYADADSLACALLEASEERMLWGSDWPHVALEQAPDTCSLLERLPRWIPSERLRERILVDNPAALYDFQ